MVLNMGTWRLCVGGGSRCDGIGHAGRDGGSTSPLLVGWRSLDDGVDVGRRKRSADRRELRARDVGRRQLHHRVESSRRTDIRNGGVETGILVRDVSRFST